MKRGGQLLSAAAVISLAACGGPQGKLEIRPIATPIAPGSKPVPFRLAEAHGQLALGNVALALESYRKAVREDPNSAEATAGMAVCYDRMGRFDLSRRYYEAALAIEPGNPGLLAAFAASLDQQGKRAEAANVRAEIAIRAAAARAVAEPVEIASAPVAVAAAGSVDLPAADFRAEPELVPAPAAIPTRVVSAPPARPPVAEPVTIASLPVSVASADRTQLPDAMFRQEPDAPEPVVAEARPTPAPAPQPVAAQAGRSVTVILPRARPAAAPKPAESQLAAKADPAWDPRPAAPQPVPAAAPDSPKPVPSAAPVAVAAAQPPKAGARLERLSLTEVALVTTSQPQWRSKLVAQGARSATLRYVPLRQPAVRSAAVLLLNAARHQGLAARTRGYLRDRGWRSLAIGNANRARATSLVLYPASRRSLGLRVAAQFGFAAAPDSSVREVMVLLGRDATTLAPLRAPG